MPPSDRAQRIAEIVEAALERDAADWLSFLDDSYGDDPSLRQEVESLLAYQKEATDFINADKRRATEIYLKVTKEKTPIAEVMEVMADPQIQYNTTPGGIQAFVDFMAKIGTLKNPPASWKDMLFPEALAGTGG